MNAKKIMGAVLVALLAAALFVGAGAAGDDIKDLGVLYTYTDVTASGLQAAADTFVSDKDGSSIMTQLIGSDYGFALSESQFDPSAYYSNGTVKFKLAVPSAVVAITVDNESIVGGSADIGENLAFVIGVDKKIGTAPTSENALVFTTPAGAQVTGTTWNVIKAVGEWEVKVDLSKIQASELLSGAPKYSATYKFTITDDETEPTISADKDSVLTGKTVLITVNMNGGVIAYDGDYFKPVDNQVGMTQENPWASPVTVKKGTYAFQALTETGDATFTFTVNGKEVEVIVSVEAGEITAVADAESYYIGSDVKLSGTSTVGGALYFYIQGTNYDMTYLGKSVTPKSDGTWKVEFKGADITKMKLDAGTYTIYVSTYNNAALSSGVTLEDAVTADTVSYTTVSVAMKQPFIAVTEAPEVVVKGADAKIKGTAEAATEVRYYIFGTNYFATGKQTSIKNGEFTITLKKDDTKDMAAGQYFMVVQHPMYDKQFNVYAVKGNSDKNQTIYTAATNASGLVDTAKATELFNTLERQSANAAEALCQALDSENIDDMYVKLSFIVAAETSVINPIQSEIVKGEKLTVSGNTNAGADIPVTVEIMSTAFAAVPKDTVGSASFISLTTKTDKDGNWEVVFDTTGLNVDEYTVSAAVGQLDATTTKVNVIEGAPVTPEQPDTPVTPEQPEQPEQPEAPATPGFGALAALAGLGAVAILLLRRE